MNGFAAASPLVKAARGEPGGTTPVWYMRQAGRSLPEYRAAREGIAMLEACLRPELVAELTAQPVRRHGVDAGIFFSDIVVPLKLAGLGVEIAPGIGPVFSEPIHDQHDLDRLPPVDEVDFSLITQAVAACVAQLGGTPLIGFAGAPFTLACYLIEGGPSRDKVRTKALAWSDPALWGSLLGWVAELSGAFLRAQVLAGASAVQLFDSWAGALGPDDYRALAAPHSRQAFAALDDVHDAHGQPVPRIHFALGGGEFLPDLAQAVRSRQPVSPARTNTAGEGAVVGVDFHVPLAEAVQRLGRVYPVQGNLDPALLFAPWPVLASRVEAVVQAGRTAPGHIVNLGHGVPADADPGVITRLTEHIHRYGAPVGAGLNADRPTSFSQPHR